MAHDQKGANIVDSHIPRAASRKAQDDHEAASLEGDLYHLNHRDRCVCFAPRRPLYSSLWPLKGFTKHLELNNNPPKQDHRLRALTGRFNAHEAEWKTIDILQYDFDSKTWVEVATMPEPCVKAHFQVRSWDDLQAYNFQDKIWIRRSDGVSQGAVFDCMSGAWNLDWRFPIFPDGLSWFHSIAPFNVLLNATTGEKFLRRCVTHD